MKTTTILFTSAWLALACCLTAACDDGNDGNDGGETWVEGDSAPMEGEDGESSTGAEPETGSTPIDEESIIVIWFGAGSVVATESFSGGLEFLVLSADAATGEETELCVMEFEIESATPSTDCEACEFAFDLTLAPPAIAAELAEGDCERFTPSASDDRSERVGFSAGQIYSHDGVGWVQAGEGSFDAATGEFSFEYEATDV